MPGSHRSLRLFRRLVTSGFPLAGSLVVPVVLGALGAAMLLLSGGCDVPKRPPLKASATAPPEPVGADTAAPSDRAGDDASDPSGEWQTWEVYQLDGQPVGFSHVTCRAGEDDSGDAVLRCVVEDEITLRRGRAGVTQRLRQTSVERPSGELLEIESELSIGPAVTRFFGSVDRSKLSLQTRRGQQRRTESLAWQAGYRGPVAIEQTLRRQPLRPGESHTLQMLLPVAHRVATVRLDCVGEASVPMFDGRQRTLLEVTSRILLEDRVVSHSVMWVDRDGRPQRTLTPALGVVGYRVDQAAAEEVIAELTDRPAPVWLGITGWIENPETAQRVAYRVSSAGAAGEDARDDGDDEEPSGDRDAAGSDRPPVAIEPVAGQYVREKAPGQFEVLVSRRAEPPSGGFARADRDSEKADLAATAALDFHSRAVRDISEAAVASEDLGEREVALELSRMVRSLMELQPSRGGVRPASEVARSTGGDPTDHAVLLAALLRARGIPSRLALGLRYHGGESSDDSPKMVYHVWTLAHAEGDWMPLDATVGRISPPDRLALVTTAAGDGELPGTMRRLLEMLGRLQIHVQGSQ